jgi:hypothetical protein
MGIEHVENLHKAGDRLHRALLAKCAAEEEYFLALAELDGASRELHLDAARWARELQLRAATEREQVKEGVSPGTDREKYNPYKKYFELVGKEVKVTMTVGKEVRRGILKKVELNSNSPAFIELIADGGYHYLYLDAVEKIDSLE